MAHQSPIDLPATSPSDASAEPAAVLRAVATTWSWRQAEFNHGAEPDGDAGVLELRGVPVRPLQLHTHAPSEHTWAGEALDGELHVVHDDGAGGLVVLGVGIVIGPEDPAVEAFLADGPGQVGQLLPEEADVWTYAGSLTTPEFDEGVQWVVLQQSITMSAAQLERLVGGRGPNAREVQDLDGRTVSAGRLQVR